MQATEQYIYDDSIYVKYLKLYVGMYANTYKKERNFEIVWNFHDRIYSYATYGIKQTSENSSYIGFRLVHYVFSMQLGTKISALCSRSFGFLSVFKANILQLQLKTYEYFI